MSEYSQPDVERPPPLILVIDDDDGVRTSIIDFLEDSGYRVLGAGGGRSGLEMIEEHHPDLAIVDLRMPEIGGLEVLSRASQANPDLPLLVVSGTGVIRDALEALRAGAWDYLLKPIEDLSILIHAVEKCLERASLRVENRAYQEHLEHLVARRTTQLQHTTQALRRSDTKYRAIFENLQDVYYETSLEGTVLDLSPSIQEVAGYQRHELIGTSIARLYERVSDRERFIQRIERDGAVQDYEVQLRSRDGEPVDCAVTAHLYRDNEDEPPRICGILRDISHRKTLESRLRHAEKMDAIGNLAGGIAHDFNNQLAGIMGYADMLSAQTADQKMRRYARSIRKAAERSSDLVRQLLAFARQGQYQSVPVDMVQVVEEVIALLEHSIDKRIAIHKLCDARKRFVTGDPSQLHSALLNVALNARDAMPEGGVMAFTVDNIELPDDDPRLEDHRRDPGTYLRVAIADTGTGMDEEVAAHVFEPFFTTRRESGGTGMGLASTYGTVRGHRGIIDLHSKPDAGTTVTILLPVGPEPRAGANFAETQQFAAGIAGDSATIMVVDDEPLVRELAKDILEELGHRVILCEDGVDAVEKFRECGDDVDLVILDIVMPRMGGTEAFHALRDIRPDVKVVVASGYSIEGEAQALLDQGCLAFVQKPFRTSTLVEKVSLALVSRPA